MVLNLLVIWFCKFIYIVLRLSGRHGGALPGVYAQKLRPSLINMLSGLPEGVIIVSGTNGKTTTTNLITQVLARNNKRVFTNHSGSNMTRGILSSIVRFTTLTGKLNFDVAVLEIDEAYGAILGPLLKPRGVVLTNVLRDQLDRFGEIDHTASLLTKLAESATEIVVYNSSDSRLKKLEELDLKAKKVSFGYSQNVSKNFVDDDSLYGGKEIEQKSDFQLTNYDRTKVYIGNIVIDSNNLFGWHNALNLVSTYALCKEMYGYDNLEMYKGLYPSYGRGEIVKYKDCLLTLQLVKNPAGFRAVIDTNPSDPSVVVINDDIADGRDVSWLWDVDFSTFKSRSAVYCSGSRAYDMAVRLKYEDINVDQDKINTSISETIENFVVNHSSGIIFLTYTGMLQTRTYLKKKGAIFGK